MAQFPTPTQIDDQYRQILKNIKPSLNTNDENSDFIIRGKAQSGLVSGLYGDQKKVNNATWINSCRPEELALFGQDLDIPIQPATASESTDVRISGTNGTVVPVGLVMVYLPTGVLYQTTSSAVISGGIADVTAQCQITGQIGNIIAPDFLQVVSPPSGIGQTANIVASFGDGSDIETTDSYRSRLLSRLQQPPAGGNATDYVNFAFAASPSVRSALIRRFGRGLGTVDIYITTGTTDIDTAVTTGQTINRIPTNLVVASVQAFFNQKVPLTDCAMVFKPTNFNVNATVNVDLAAGLTLSSVPSDAVNNPNGLNVQNLIIREVSRAIYKMSVGGRVLPGLSGSFVVASDIENNLDIWLSAVIDPVTGFPRGKIPVLADRQIQPLNGMSYNLPCPGNGLPNPATITVVLGV